jgi:hypothetical protein
LPIAPSRQTVRAVFPFTAYAYLSSQALTVPSLQYFVGSTNPYFLIQT